MLFFSFEAFLLINNCLNNNYLIIKLASFQLLKIIPMNFRFIALTGVTVEVGVLMLVYLNQSYCRMSHELMEQNRCMSREDVKAAVLEGAGQRVRPIVMTVAAIVVGLIPIMYSSGTGS